jgi:hypothetical protein
MSLDVSEAAFEPEDDGDDEFDALIAEITKSKKRQPSAAERMMRLLEERYEAGITPEGDVFAVERDGPRVALLLARYGSMLRAGALKAFRDEFGETPSANAARDALAMFEAETRFAGLEPTRLYMRFAHDRPDRLLVDGRTLELANAPELGEESTAEETEDHFSQGRPGILFEARRPSVEPSPEMSDEDLRGLLVEVYSGAPWVDLDRLLREVRDPGAPWTETTRFFFNMPCGGTLAAVSPALWASRQAARKLVEGERISLGFDGSHSRDGTALIACTEDGFLCPIEIIERPARTDEWRVDRSRIHRALEDMFERFDVAYVYCDPWRWQDEIAEWADRWPERRSSCTRIRIRGCRGSSTASARRSRKAGSLTTETKPCGATFSTHGCERSAGTRTGEDATRWRRLAPAG